jgi:hypothetical protein
MLQALDGLVDLGFRACGLSPVPIGIGLALMALLWLAVDGTLVGARPRAAVVTPR